jgi:hypothetical protein
MTPTTKTRKKICSAAERRAEEGDGPRDQVKSRNPLWVVVVVVEAASAAVAEVEALRAAVVRRVAPDSALHPVT